MALEELSGLNVQLRVSALGDDAPLVGAGVAWFSNPGTPTTNATHEGTAASAK